MNAYPPRWAERFLNWYCNPDIVEEIQGDAHELYQQRLLRYGKRTADLKYVWDVIRFFRWSNIRPARAESLVSALRIARFNTKISFRNAARAKSMFAIKTLGLAASLSFALILLVYLAQELSSDKFHTDYDRIYRVTSRVAFPDHVTHYAVTPFPLGPALTTNIPTVESYTRFTYQESPLFKLEDDYYSDLNVFVADSRFLKLFTFGVVAGDPAPLRVPNTIVITSSLAERWFADQDPIGKTLTYANDVDLEVIAVVKDPPPGSHLQFDALISWDTFDQFDDWSNLNAYTYIMLARGSTIADVKERLTPVIHEVHELVAREYDATFQPQFENVADVHFSSSLDEDVAVKKSRQELLIVGIVVVLLLITGLINYLNISLAQLTTQIKRVAIQNIFGGSSGSAWKSSMSDTLVNAVVTLPLVIVILLVSRGIIGEYFTLRLDLAALRSELFLYVSIAFICVLFLSTVVNSFVLSKASALIATSRKTWVHRTRGIGFRTVLVAAQIAFSLIMIALMNIMGDQMKYIRSSAKGFDDVNTLIVKLRSPDQTRIESFKNELVRHSGIMSVEETSYYPGQVESKWVFEVESERGMKQMLLPMIRCGADYLKTLNIPLIKGRSFNDSRDDRHHAFVINETAVRDLGWKDPIGKQIRGPVSGQDEAYKDGVVIGVVKDFHFGSMHERVEPLIIFLTDDGWPGSYVYVKFQQRAAHDAVNAIHTFFQRNWPDTPFEYEFLDSKYLSLYRADDQLRKVFQLAWVISILLSSFGVFSISALLVSVRMKEIGVRKVLGANAFDLLLLHWKSFAILIVIAVCVGFPVSWFLATRWLQNYSYHIELSSWHFLIPALVAIVVTLLVSVYHSAKASRTEPVTILKHE